MAQPKNNKSKKSTTNSPRKNRVIKLSKDLKEDSQVNAKHIAYQSFGSDRNKTRKNSKACDRGTSSGPARYCSSHIRQIYDQDILGDNNMTEWCVEGRHNEECCSNNNNPCRLCNINTTNYDNSKYIKLPMINFAEALRAEMRVSFDKAVIGAERYNRALKSFLTSHIIQSYPGTNKENTILRIRVNDEIWMEYFIKLTAFSSLLKTSAPSGYKYQDRISIGRKIKIQNNKNKDLIFCVEKDASYNDPEKEADRPVVNCVGFWNLLNEAKENEIRNIIHLNINQGVNVCFGFLMKNNHNVNKIEVELECTRHDLGLEEKPITLWCWPSNVDDNNSMSSLDNIEHKSNTSGSPTISAQSLPSARSTSPITHHMDYSSFPQQNEFPTIPTFPNIPTIPMIENNNISMATMPTLPQLPIQHSMNNNLNLNNFQYQPQINYDRNNNYQSPTMNDNNSMSSDDIMEHKSNSSGSPTISMQSPTSAPPTFPITDHANYPSFPPSTMAALPPQLPIQRGMNNNSQYQPQIPHNNNNYQGSIDDNDNISCYSYGPSHGANYVDYRYAPYPIRQQRAAPISNSNNNIPQIIEFTAKSEPQPQINEDRNVDQHQSMEQDEFIAGQDELLFPQNFDILNTDNQTLFEMNGMNGFSNQQLLDTGSVSFFLTSIEYRIFR